jgi:hypothetical protein
MNIPDPMVYASIPLMGTALVWLGRQFVLSVSPKPKGLKAGTMPDITVRTYQQISSLMKQELDGVYMPAKETRERFDALERKFEALMLELTLYMSIEQQHHSKVLN